MSNHFESYTRSYNGRVSRKCNCKYVFYSPYSDRARKLDCKKFRIYHTLRQVAAMPTVRRRQMRPQSHVDIGISLDVYMGQFHVKCFFGKSDVSFFAQHSLKRDSSLEYILVRNKYVKKLFRDTRLNCKSVSLGGRLWKRTEKYFRLGNFSIRCIHV